MKKLVVMSLLFVPLLIKATNYTSVASGNWSSSSTWSPAGVPGASDTATIANSVTLNANESIFNIVINSGSTLAVSGSSTLTIGGNFTNNGTFTASTGTVTFSSTGAQTLGGSSATTFYLFTKTGSGGTVTLGNNITVTSNFLISSGTVDVSTYNYSVTIDGNFTNNGTYQYRNGTTTFSGSSAQTLSGTDYFYNLTINGSVSCGVYIYIANNITINYGKSYTMTGGGSFAFQAGSITNNGTFIQYGPVSILGTGTVISGTGTFAQSGYNNSFWYFTNSPQTIAAGVNLTFNDNTPIMLDVSDAHLYFGLSSSQGIVITNLGTVVSDDYVSCNGTSSTPSKWINGVNSSFTESGPPFMNSYDTLDATATGNTFTWNGPSGFSWTIVNSKNSKYYNLTINAAGTTYKLPASLIVENNLTINAGTLDVTTSNYNLTIGGNFTNSATFTQRSSTVTFNGSTNQTTSGVGAFYNLTENQGINTDTLFLSNAVTVNNNLTLTEGTFACKTFQITGNTTGTMTMSSGAGLVLGLPSSTTAVSFPTSFTTAHTTLNANSTVTYQSNVAQTISSVPSAYGNLALSTGSMSTTKTTGSTSLTVAGTLTINSNTTLSGINGSLILGGNFTNNGTYATSTSNLIFNGSVTQIIGGSTTTSFYNMTLAGTGTVKPSYALNISKSLRINSGTLDVTSSNYNVTIGGSLVDNGGIFIPHSNKVTLNGSGNDTLGGSTSLSVDTLIIGNSGTTYLGGNVTTASNVTINSGTTFNGLSNTLTTAGNFIDNGTFTASTGTVSFNKNGHQCIQGSSTPTFNNLTIGALSILGTSGSLNITGMVTILPGGQMACSCSLSVTKITIQSE